MKSISLTPVVLSPLCFFGGSLCALGMAPYNIWGVFIIGFGILYLSIDRAQSKKAAFGYGWLWAFGYFVFSLYWIGNALLVDGNPYKWAWLLAVCGLPALLAFFNAFSCLIAYQYFDLKRWHGYLSFASLLSLFEYLRGHLFTGFPWNLYGYTWADTLQIMQVASLESVYLLTFLTLAWLCFAGFTLVSNRKREKIVLGIVIVASMATAYGFGEARLSDDLVLRDDIRIKIVQPNTDQAEKWQRDKMVGHFENALRLSRIADTDKGSPIKTLIIWPETAISPAFLNAPYYRGKIADMLNEYSNEAVLVTGALRYQSEDETYHNSLIAIHADGSISNTYDKSHLVPFGEYIPFQKWIPLAPIVQFQGFSQGKGVETFSLFEDLHYSPLICYEIIFPNTVVESNTKPDFIINVTNDGWYGTSPGPYQHLVKARFRAVEEGIPVLRAANTGVSAIIDPFGRIVAKSQLFTQDTLSIFLPARRLLTTEKYIFSFFYFPCAPLFFIALTHIFLRIRKHND